MKLWPQLTFRRHKHSAHDSGPLDATEALHVAIDDLTKTLYIDQTRRSSVAIQQWMAEHRARTGLLYAVVWEPFSDITRRRNEIREVHA